MLVLRPAFCIKHTDQEHIVWKGFGVPLITRTKEKYTNPVLVNCPFCTAISIMCQVFLLSGQGEWWLIGQQGGSIFFFFNKEKMHIQFDLVHVKSKSTSPARTQAHTAFTFCLDLSNFPLARTQKWIEMLPCKAFLHPFIAASVSLFGSFMQTGWGDGDERAFAFPTFSPSYLFLSWALAIVWWREGLSVNLEGWRALVNQSQLGHHHNIVDFIDEVSWYLETPMKEKRRERSHEVDTFQNL